MPRWHDRTGPVTPGCPRGGTTALPDVGHRPSSTMTCCRRRPAAVHRPRGHGSDVPDTGSHKVAPERSVRENRPDMFHEMFAKAGSVRSSALQPLVNARATGARARFVPLVITLAGVRSIRRPWQTAHLPAGPSRPSLPCHSALGTLLRRSPGLPPRHRRAARPGGSSIRPGLGAGTPTVCGLRPSPAPVAAPVRFRRAGQVVSVVNMRDFRSAGGR